MNPAHYHLIVNHFPIITPILGMLVLLTGLLLKSEATQKTAYGLFILGSLSTLLAGATGEGAEEVIEQLPNINEQLIKIHEEASEVFSVASYVLGICALILLWGSWKNLSWTQWGNYLILVVSAGVIYLATVTGSTGGEIRHPEISTTNTLNLQAPSQKEYHDEDGEH